MYLNLFLAGFYETLPEKLITPPSSWSAQCGVHGSGDPDIYIELLEVFKKLYNVSSCELNYKTPVDVYLPING